MLIINKKYKALTTKDTTYQTWKQLVGKKGHNIMYGMLNILSSKQKSDKTKLTKENKTWNLTLKIERRIKSVSTGDASVLFWNNSKRLQDAFENCIQINQKEER
jgi:hypothetical protein